MSNPYAPTAAVATADPLLQQEKQYGGIGRAIYFGLSFAIGVVYNLLSILIANVASVEVLGFVALGMAVMYLASLLVIVWLRIVNMGYSGWWIIAMAVPLLNILIAMRCLMCPTGYADTRKLDPAGKVIAGIFVAFFLLLILSVFVSVRA